jgi:hypothetical protein
MNDRWFRTLLRLFPMEFRGDFGQQMAEDFREQREEAGARRGPRGIRRLWLRTVVDIVRRAPQEHADVLRRDAAHAIRILRRRPASAATVIASIAIGIGLNTALFTVVWRSTPSSPFANPDEAEGTERTDQQRRNEATKDERRRTSKRSVSTPVARCSVVHPFPPHPPFPTTPWRLGLAGRPKLFGANIAPR